MNKQGGVQKRRENVIARLQAQLKSGTKQAQIEIGSKSVLSNVELSEYDVKRINREIEVLKVRVQ